MEITDEIIEEVIKSLKDKGYTDSEIEAIARKVVEWVQEV